MSTYTDSADDTSATSSDELKTDGGDSNASGKQVVKLMPSDSDTSHSDDSHSEAFSDGLAVAIYTNGDEDDTCTCGKCLDGWLSPRKAHQLKVGAQKAYDALMNMHADSSMQGDNVVAGDTPEMIPLSNIPDGLRKEGLSMKFIFGYAQTFSLLVYVIDSLDGAPARTDMEDVLRIFRDDADSNPVTGADSDFGFVDHYLSTVKTWIGDTSAGHWSREYDQVVDGYDFVLEAAVEMAECLLETGLMKEEDMQGKPNCDHDAVEWESVLAMLKEL